MALPKLCMQQSFGQIALAVFQLANPRSAAEPNHNTARIESGMFATEVLEGLEHCVARGFYKRSGETKPRSGRGGPPGVRTGRLVPGRPQRSPRWLEHSDV